MATLETQLEASGIALVGMAIWLLAVLLIAGFAVYDAVAR